MDTRRASTALNRWIEAKTDVRRVADALGIDATDTVTVFWSMRMAGCDGGRRDR